MSSQEVIERLLKIEPQLWRLSGTLPIGIDEYRDAILQAIASLKEYEELKGKIDVDDIGFLIYKTWGKFSEKTAREDWTSKHIQPLAKIKSHEFAQALVAYLTTKKG